MLKEYDTKYMLFRIRKQNRKTAIWEVMNKSSGGRLGIIGWHPPWRQYCFFPEDNCVFNVSCMSDIIKTMSKIRVAEMREEVLP